MPEAPTHPRSRRVPRAVSPLLGRVAYYYEETNLDSIASTGYLFTSLSQSMLIASMYPRLFLVPFIVRSNNAPPARKQIKPDSIIYSARRQLIIANNSQFVTQLNKLVIGACPKTTINRLTNFQDIHTENTPYHHQPLYSKPKSSSSLRIYTTQSFTSSTAPHI